MGAGTFMRQLQFKNGNEGARGTTIHMATISFLIKEYKPNHMEPDMSSGTSGRSINIFMSTNP